MKLDRRRFPLSEEADVLTRSHGWERVELADGPAAQAVVAGVSSHGSSPEAEPEVPAESDVHPDQQVML